MVPPAGLDSLFSSGLEDLGVRMSLLRLRWSNEAGANDAFSSKIRPAIQIAA